MHLAKKIGGYVLVIVSLIRWIPDLLESAQATAKYGTWLYKHAGFPRSGILTLVILIVGVGLIFSEVIQERVKRWFQKKEESKSTVRPKAPITIEISSSGHMNALTDEYVSESHTHTIERRPLSEVRKSLKNANMEWQPSQVKLSAISLADEIAQFLASSGPRPKPQITDGMTEEEILAADSDKIGSYVERIHYIYAARFRDRLLRVINEIHALGIHDYQLDALVDPQVQNEDNLQVIVEKLRHLAARIKG